MLPSLWLNSASSTPPELVIREGAQVLGRSADADICLDETFVSGYHARLNWNGGQLTILDLNSTNGTLVNGVPVVGWTSLTDDDIIEFGGVEATVRLPPSSEPTPVVGSTTPPPPPAPSSQRQPEVDIDLRSDDGIEPESTLNTTGEFAAVDPVADRVFGSRLGPVVSDRTEPVFEQPLTWAVTLPPTPPAGVSISPLDPDVSDHLDRYDDLDGSGFDFGDHRDPGSSLFNNRGLRITIGTAALVLLALLVIAALIIYVIR